MPKFQVAILFRQAVGPDDLQSGTGTTTTSMNEECGDRIAELQQVEKVRQHGSEDANVVQKICELLRESGLAIQCLAPGESIQSRKEEFEKHAEDFARLLEVTSSFRPFKTDL